ncbi:MAG TPA: exodeoxyribonuclease VII small subunit [Methanocorpusculum sp.]|nr:exodeoxyribonuclease VII small subunit [Methanocorpusculum sp.]
MTETEKEEKEKELSYEEMITELKEIAKKLDNPDTNVEDAVKLHKRGMELIAKCEAFLAQAELTITELHPQE